MRDTLNAGGFFVGSILQISLLLAVNHFNSPMGSGRDKRKKQKGKPGGQGALKTAKKTEKNQEKQHKRTERASAARMLVIDFGGLMCAGVFYRIAATTWDFITVVL